MKTKKNCIVSSQRDKISLPPFQLPPLLPYDQIHRGNYLLLRIIIIYRGETSSFTVHSSHFTRTRVETSNTTILARARMYIYECISRKNTTSTRIRTQNTIYIKKKPRIYSRWIGYEDLGEIRALCWEQWCDGTSNAARKRK